MTARSSVVLFLTALATLACRGAAERPRNVLLVSFDTTRADRIGCYGRANAGTPTLDALAARGTRFADATAANPTTLPSHATLFTGQDPLRHRVRNNGMFALAPTAVTLAERCAAAGVRTGAFVGSMVLAERYGLAQGFDEYSSPAPTAESGLFYVSERAAAEVNQDALAWIDGIGAARFLLFVHYMEPHIPYVPPEPERSRFADDRYQGEIAAADRALGELLRALDERGRLDGTLVVAVADHGESLGDHGESNHGIFLYQSTLHVPFVVAGPGAPPGRTIHEPVGLVDVTPTLLEALGIVSDGEPLDGRSLWPVLGGAPCDQERSLYAETFLPRYDFGWSELRVLRRGPLKYVAAPAPELYRLDRDPGEALNLYRTEVRSAEPLAAELAAWIARVEAEGQDPQRIPISPEERKVLASLGYLAGAGAADAVGDLADPKDRIGEAGALGDAEELMHRGEHPAAERLLRELIAARPSYLSARTRLVLALALQGQTEQTAEEVRAFGEVARHTPDGARFVAQARLVLARLYLDQRRIEDAAREYELALVAPQPAEVYDLLAAIYHDLGRRQDAIRLLRRVVERGDAQPRSLELLRRFEAEGSPSGNPGPGAS